MIRYTTDFMTTQARKSNVWSFLQEIYAVPGGEGIRLCTQCGACAGICPAAGLMQHSPRQLIALARSGSRDQALASNAMRFCLSCYLCNEHCPQEARPADFMLAMEHLSSRRGVAHPRVRTPATQGGFPGVALRRPHISIKETRLQPDSARQVKAIIESARSRGEYP